MKPLPNSLEYNVEGSTRVSVNNSSNFTKDSLSDSVDELWVEFSLASYPPHVRNLLTQTVTHEEVRIYSGATIETAGSFTSVEGQSQAVKPLHLLIRSTKRSNIDRAVTWIQRLIDQAMNLPKYKEKVLIGLENASPGFDVRGKVLGPGGANLQYITNETGAIVTLRGRGSGFIEPTTGLESIEPLHLCVEHNSKYEVLQAGRQLAFNLIETVQQEWYTYQQQQQNTNSTLQTQPHSANNTLQSQSHTTNSTLQTQSHSANTVLQTQQHAAVSPVMQHAPPQHLHMPPPTHSGPPHQGSVASGQLVPPPTTAVPPPLISSSAVPPPLVHQPPPTTLQLATNLSQLVQAPPPHLQANQLSQPPPQLVQSAQLVQPQTSQSQQLVQTGQTAQLVQPQTSQPQQLVQSGQLVQASQQPQPQLMQQPPSLSIIQQSQPSILQTQQALSQGMLMPGTGVGPGQTVQVVQTSQLSAAIQPSPQPTLQEIPPTHVYSTGAGSGAGTQVANILTQQMLPAGTSIIQQPHIISQTSYPQLQYMQGGGGSMAVVYGTPGAATGGREGVMLVQYAGGATAGARRIQPQIVQLVHPGTGQVVGAAPLLLQGPSTPLVLQQPSPAPPPTSLLLQQPSGPPPPVSTATVLLQQSAAPQHQLQFTAQPQPIHILPPPHQAMMTVSSSGQVVSSGAQSSAMVTSSQHGLVSISPHAISSPPVGRAIISTQGQKRRFEQDHITIQGNAITGALSISEVSSLHKKGVGEGSPTKELREQLSQSSTPSSLHSKLVLPASQSDEQDVLQISRVEMKPDSVKRGRTTHGDELDLNKESKNEYSYGSGKVNYSQPPPQSAAAPLQQHASALQQSQQHLQQGLVSAQLASSLPPPAAPFTAPPPHYPPQYYQQPPYQAYQPTWSHMHSNSNQ